MNNSPWDYNALKSAPPSYPGPYPADTSTGTIIHNIFLDTLDYQGHRTRAFAYYGIPMGSDGQPVPGVVLVHGGGGTAFIDWVQKWNERGYAAIAVDLEGHLPDPEGQLQQHSWSGPARNEVWGDIKETETDQWMYHAVADVILAHSFLRSKTGVNPNHVGVVGISWGGIVTNIVAGIDNRFAFAVPVYGCSYLYESPSYFGEVINAMDAEDQQAYRDQWEPSVYLKNAAMPILWVNSDIDSHFPVIISSKSHSLVQHHSTLSIVPDLGHSHQDAWNLDAIYLFADSVTKGGASLPKISGVTNHSLNNRQITVNYTSESAINSAELRYTKDPMLPQPIWIEQNIPIVSGVIQVTLPEDAQASYINVTNAQGTASTNLLLELDVN